MPDIQTGVYARMFDLCRTQTLAAAAGVPEAARLFQLRENKATPLWLVGHNAVVVNNVLLQWTLGGESLLPLSVMRTFAPAAAGGKPISVRAEDYPPWEEVLTMYDRTMQAAQAAVAALDDSALGESFRGKMPERLQSRWQTIEDVLQEMPGHDAYHRGQLALLSSYHTAV